MSQSVSSTTSPLPAYDAPPAPREGQVFIDTSGGYWKVKRLTLAENPAGFYLVHLGYGTKLESLNDSMILGPREFAALTRERDLKPHLHSV